MPEENIYYLELNSIYFLLSVGLLQYRTVQIGLDAHDTIIFGAWTCNTVFSPHCTMQLCPAWLKVLVKSVDQSSPAPAAASPPTVHRTCTALHAHPGLTCVIFRPGAAVGFHRQWTLVVFCAETLGNITATLPTTLPSTRGHANVECVTPWSCVPHFVSAHSVELNRSLQRTMFSEHRTFHS